MVSLGAREAMERDAETLHGYGLWLTINDELVTDTPEPDEAASLEDLMARFRRNADGATARFAAVEVAIIRDLVGQVIELIGT